MNNAEEVDGFFAALICSPEIAKPSEYLPEIWGGEMDDDEAFADQEELQNFLNLIFRHWNSIARMLEEEDVFTPLLFEDEEGTAQANNWGTRIHAWRSLPSCSLGRIIRRRTVQSVGSHSGFSLRARS